MKNDFTVIKITEEQNSFIPEDNTSELELKLNELLTIMLAMERNCASIKGILSTPSKKKSNQTKKRNESIVGLYNGRASLKWFHLLPQSNQQQNFLEETKLRWRIIVESSGQS